MLREGQSEKPGRLVIFGCGYVGSRLAAEAVGRGYRVTALSRNPDRFEAFSSLERIDGIVADLASDDWHGQIDPQPDVLVNCVSSGGGGVSGYRRSYVEGMESIARWLSGGGAGVAVYTGSIGVYSRNDGTVVDENAEVGGHSEFADLLVAAERRFMDSGFAAERRVVLRLAGIYGLGRHAFLDRIVRSEGPLPGRGDAVMNAVHVEDVCGAVWAAIDRAEEGVAGLMNVVDDCPAPRREVADWLASRLGLPAPRFEETESSGSGPRRSLNRRIANDKAKDLLGWRPRYPDYKQGYEEILKMLGKS